MDLNAENQHPVTTEGGEIGVDWSEDGRILVAAWDRGNQGCCNFVMEPDGSNIIQAGGKGEMQKYLPFRTLDGNKVECSGWRSWEISLCGIPDCHKDNFSERIQKIKSEKMIIKLIIG